MDRTIIQGPALWIVAALGLLGAGGMLFEGVRAFLQDEATRESATQIQQLGPWARVLVESGLRPRSPTTNSFFLVYGASWLAITAAFVLGFPWARWGLLAAAVGSLWYLGPGTLISVLLLVGLFVTRR